MSQKGQGETLEDFFRFYNLDTDRRKYLESIKEKEKVDRGPLNRLLHTEEF